MLNKIRFKLTLTNSIVLFAILFFISVFVFINVNFNAINNTDKDLVNSAYELKRYITIIENKETTPENAALDEEYTIFTEKMSSSSIAYGIWDETSELIIYRSNFKTSFDALDIIRTSIFLENTFSEKIISEADGTYYIHTYNYDDINIRVCTTIVSNDNGDLRYIQTISNMDAKNSMADRLLNALIIAGLIGITLSFISGYFIAGRAIIPIQESIQRQKELIADASHELRTPVTIVRTNLDVVRASQEDTIESQINWIDNAYDETKRMEKLISDLLFLAKADLNQEEMQIIELDINAICKSISDKFIPAAAEKDVEIIFDPKQNHLHILGDHSKINQLIYIILDNAINYSAKGGKVHITTDKFKHYAQITISDQGIGIAKKDINNIFKRFYRTDKARTRREGGTGLGLSIAKWIVEAHKGEIYAESEKSKGTKMIINLPLKEGDKI